MAEWVWCNYCGRKTQHENWIDREVTWDIPTPEDEPPDYELERHQVFQCLGCMNVHHLVTSSGMHPDWVTRYPPKTVRKAPDWVHHLPFATMTLMWEIYKALASDSKVLAAIGARTVFDRFLVNVVGDVGTFKEKCDKLVAGGFVTKTDGEVLYTALDNGNAAAHRGHEPTDEELNTVFDILEHVLQAHYVIGPAAKKLATQTPARTKPMIATPKPPASTAPPVPAQRPVGTPPPPTTPPPPPPATTT